MERESYRTLEIEHILTWMSFLCKYMKGMSMYTSSISVASGYISYYAYVALYVCNLYMHIIYADKQILFAIWSEP